MDGRIGVFLMAAIIPLAVASPVPAGAQEATPYAGLETRKIKALSPEQIEAYRSGSGMGLALAAELNRYPGPKHVIELRAQLGLADEQSRLVQQVLEAMSSSAIELGHRIVALEGEIDAAFADRSISEEQLQAQLTALAELKGRLRFTHLSAHLKTVEILTPHQIEMYQMLRGYDAAGHDGHHPGHGQGGGG